MSVDRPVGSGIEREQLRRIAIGIAALQSEQVGIGPARIAHAKRGLETLGHLIAQAGFDPPSWDARELRAFGSGRGSIAQRLGVDPGGIGVDVHALDRPVAGFGDQLEPILPGEIDILEASQVNPKFGSLFFGRSV